MKIPRPLFFWIPNVFLFCSIAFQSATTASQWLILANVYRPNMGVTLSDYWVSEKYDGVRGYWDGQHLKTRTGQQIHAPTWFTETWPDTPLDGELWAGRGRFEYASGTVRQQIPHDDAWRQITFMVFDLPAHRGVFNERMMALNQLIKTLNLNWVKAVKQFKVNNEAQLYTHLKHITHAGGEGLMLHKGDTYYRGWRTNDLLKLKSYDDSEAKVIAHLPGKGKYSGMMGALLVETPTGKQFRLGTGFTDAQRRNPPPIGSWVTYRYRGLTKKGLPRFASFMRVRDDGVLPDGLNSHSHTLKY